MKRLGDVRAAIKQRLEEVVAGLRILAGMAQPGEPALAPATVNGAVMALRAQVDEVVRLSALDDSQSAPVRVPCPFCQQLIMPTAILCGFCWRRLTPAAAG
ncbi:MAG TPA: hypothetical protein VH853_04835 [Polyangia bacterium]|jgi:hypothetical protein|nr:hypothetical protein [Polyangia bacterium]